MYGAGGFSYKSMWTLQELFPLINFGCKFCQIATKNIHISARFGYEFGKMAHNQGYSVYHSDITATRKKDKKMRDEKRESDEEEVNSL